jgi:tetratricopeptide (TPR) repeat protein
MDQQKLLDSVQAWLTSIGLAHPNLPECTSAVIPSSQFLQVVENGCKASNIVLTKEKNPWAKEEPDVSDLPVFKEFLEKITKQGYFNGSPEGSEKYQIKYDKALSKFRAKLQKKAEKKAAEKPNGPTKEEAQLQATELKNKGNACLSKQEFGNALDFYKQAISVCSDGPSSHIFYANAAAALIHMERYEEAAEMCAFSIALNGDYAKSHTRLGYAKIQMNDCQGAIVSLERALELSPNNALATKHLATARNMSSGLNVPSNGGSAQPTGGPLGGAGGMPDFASMMQGLGGGGGGGGGLGAMMQQMMR